MPDSAGSRRQPDIAVQLLSLPGSDAPLVDALNDAVVVAAPDNRIVYANRATQTLLGWEPDELVGRPVSTLVPERLRPAHVAGFSAYVRTGRARVIGQPLSVPARRADGSEVAIELLLSTLKLRSGELIVATLRDVRERVDLERQNALAHDLLRVLAEGAGGAVPRILEAIAQTLGWDVAALWMPVEGSALLGCRDLWHHPQLDVAAFVEMTHRMKLRPGRGLPGRVWEAEQPVWIVDLHDDVNFPRAATARSVGLHVGFAFPIVASTGKVGVIELFRREPSPPDETLLAAMPVIGSRLGEFLMRAQAEEERRRMSERERAVAFALQRSLLPPKLPAVPGVEVAARFHPGGEVVVGGDFYDCFALPSGGWAIAIGDVCGTGPEAAAMTAQVRHSARALARTEPGPGALLEHVNSLLVDPLELEPRFCTSVYGFLHADDDTVGIVLANAGHPLPLVLRADGTVEECAVLGTLLGVVPGARYDEVSVVLNPGDAILLYTDGVTEARTADGFLGEERLREVVAACRGLDAEQMASTVEQLVLGAVTADATDDVALLVVRRPG